MRGSPISNLSSPRSQTPVPLVPKLLFGNEESVGQISFLRFQISNLRSRVPPSFPDSRSHAEPPNRKNRNSSSCRRAGPADNSVGRPLVVNGVGQLTSGRSRASGNRLPLVSARLPSFAWKARRHQIRQLRRVGSYSFTIAYGKTPPQVSYPAWFHRPDGRGGESHVFQLQIEPLAHRPHDKRRPGCGAPVEAVVASEV